MMIHSPSTSAFMPTGIKYALILALGSFSMGNAKFSIMQLLPLIAVDFNVTVTEVEDVIWAYTLGSVIGAPIIAILMCRLPKQSLIFILSCGCFLGNLLSAFAPTLETLFWLRFFSGVPHAAYLALAALLIAELTPPSKRGFYIGLVFCGLAAAMTVSVPFNALLGQLHGWEVSFLFVALVDILTGLLIKDLLPKPVQGASASVVTRLAHWKDYQHIGPWLWCGISFGIMIAMMVLWSHSLASAQLLLGGNHIVIALMLSVGLAVGQVMGGVLADRQLSDGVFIGCVLVAWLAAMLSLQYANTMWLGAAFIGSFGMVITIIQVKLLQYPVASQRFFTCIHMSLIQLAALIGPWWMSLSLLDGLWLVSVLVVLASATWYFYQSFSRHIECSDGRQG